jgi:hypothetical protein
MRFTRISIAAAAALAVAAGGAALSPAASGASAPAAQAGQYKVSLKASAKVVVAGEEKVKLTGTVFPVPPEGSKVLVQAKYENLNTWAKTGTAKVKSDGSYKFVDKPQTSRDRVYRVMKRTDKVATADKSRERSVQVIAWQWLDSTTPSAAENVALGGTVPINGDDYPHTLFVPRTSPSGFIEFTLGRNCFTLETTFGLSDRTETGGRATILMGQDGAPVYARTFDLGQSEAFSKDVTDVYRIRFDFVQVPETPQTEPSIGAGRVLCD